MHPDGRETLRDFVLLVTAQSLKIQKQGGALENCAANNSVMQKHKTRDPHEWILKDIVSPDHCWKCTQRGWAGVLEDLAKSLKPSELQISHMQRGMVTPDFLCTSHKRINNSCSEKLSDAEF